MASINKKERIEREEKVKDYLGRLKELESQCDDKDAFSAAMNRFKEAKRIKKKAQREISEAKAKIEELERKYGK